MECGFERFKSVIVKTFRSAIVYARKNPFNYFLILVGV